MPRGCHLGARSAPSVYDTCPAKPVSAPRPIGSVPASRWSRSRGGRCALLCPSSSGPCGSGGSLRPCVGVQILGTLARPAGLAERPLDRLYGIHGLLQDL